MNHGDHETTSSDWEVIRKQDGKDYMEMRITSTVEGCPYDFSVTVKVTQKQLLICPDGRIGTIKLESEMDAHALMWDRIHRIKQLLMSQPVHDWTMKDWLTAAPFLFTDSNGRPLDDDLLNEEEMQKVRDTWR